MTLSPGQMLQHDRYRIEGPLGRGGMGTVYKASDLSLNILVAIKENLETSTEAQKQFNREATILARLAHNNLPRVTDYFIVPGQGQYLVMDFVEGEDLQAMLERLGQLPEPQVLNWVSQICEALAYLHSQPQPIIHRDIKPANIRIRPDGRAMLVDFGIAKVYDPHTSTTVGARAITPGFSPPEQYGGGNTDQRSDIYALGATIYALLTGHTMPESVDRVARNTGLTLPHEYNHEISPQVEQAILRSTEISTERRYQSAQELREALTRPLEPPTLVNQPPLVQPIAPTMVVDRPAGLPRQAAPAGAGSPARPAAPRPSPAAPRQPARRSPWPDLLGGALGVLLPAALCLGGGYYAWLTAQPSSTPTMQAALPPTAAPHEPSPTTAPAQPEKPPTAAPASALPPSPTLVPSPTPPPAPLPPTPTKLPPNRYLAVAAIKLPDPKQTMRGVAASGPNVYLLTTEGTLYVYETPAHSPEQPFVVVDQPLSQQQVGNGNGLLRVGNFLYVYGFGGLNVMDISDPGRPIPGYAIPENSIINLIQVGDLLIGPGSGGFSVFSVADPARPRLISYTRTESNLMHFAAAVYDQRIYMSVINLDTQVNGLELYDFTDPAAPKLISRLEHSPLGYHFFLAGNQMIACADFSAIETWSLANPLDPVMVYSEPAEARGCARDSDNMITNGLIFRIVPGGTKAFDKFDPQVGQGDGLPYGSAVQGDFVYLAQMTQALVLAGLP